jgi:hypothetical protein
MSRPLKKRSLIVCQSRPVAGPVIFFPLISSNGSEVTITIFPFFVSRLLHLTMEWHESDYSEEEPTHQTRLDGLRTARKRSSRGLCSLKL